ncbi:hypothetical protein [Streptomyces sp. NPDC059909]|uniref:hypothetical protein n=1 Tax=Streptomyces sp. NPDC059909 TaxID=3346998 RepID=UPI0036669661
MVTRLGGEITYPLYEPCPPGFAESRLTGERLARLVDIYWGDAELRLAEIGLEEELTKGSFTVVTTTYPNGRAWMLEDYRTQHYNQVAAAPAATTPELIDKLHFWHSCGYFFLDAESSLREEAPGRGFL